VVIYRLVEYVGNVFFVSDSYSTKHNMFMRTTEKSFEADNQTGLNHEGRHANEPLERLTATSIIGDRVVNPEGEDLGKIDNLMVNLHSGVVEYAVLQFGAFMGIGGKLFAIPFDELRVDREREVMVLNRDKAYLKECPGFDQSHWPKTNDHTYFGNVDAYWGYAQQP